MKIGRASIYSAEAVDVAGSFAVGDGKADSLSSTIRCSEGNLETRSLL